MKPCRLKIITACINPDEKESDTEIIHYVSKNDNTLSNIQYNNIMEEEKNINSDNLKEEEEEAIIIRDKDDLKKKKKISKEKVYLIEGLFSSNYNSNKKKLFHVENKSINISQTPVNNEKDKDKDNQKLRSIKNNNVKNGKKIYKYKWENKHDNKINIFYSRSKKSSKTGSQNKIEIDKFFSPPENPFAFNFYKTNKEIDSNIAGLYDYKKKIKELLDEEPKKLEDRDNIMKENKTKMEGLLKENTKLNYELGFEINREDELRGEIIILKNKYEILFNQLNKEEMKIKQYQDILKHKSDHEKQITNKKNEIINYYNNLDECLTNGDILLVTKPDFNNKFNYINTKNIENFNNINNVNNINDNENKDVNNKDNDNDNNLNNINTDNNNIDNNINNNNNDNENNTNLKMNSEIKDNIDKTNNNNEEISNYINYDLITLLLKGYFINMNLTNIEEIVNKIWIYEKPLQTFESLTEELLQIIDNYINQSNYTFINEHNRNIIMHYFYSFCNNYNYMTKNEFISVFKDQLGHFIVYNENYLMSKLYLYSKGKLSEFMKILKDLDKNDTGKIDINEFIKALKDNNMIINNNDYNENVNQIDEKNLLEQNDIYDLIQFIIINMKKNVDLDKFLDKNKDNNNMNDEKNQINKKGFINIYDLYYNSLVNIIIENSKSKMPLYKGIIKNYIIDKNLNSMMTFLEPLLLNNDIIINKGLNRYIKTQSFNDFLIKNNVIGENEIFLIPFSEEDLIEINALVQDIDQAKPLLYDYGDKKNI